MTAKKPKVDVWDKLAPGIVVVGAMFVGLFVWLAGGLGRIYRFITGKDRRRERK